MSEVLRASYEDPDDNVTFGVEADELLAGTTRAVFDDVDDYHGWSSASIEDRSGGALAGGASWAQSVTVELVVPVNPGTVSGTDLGLKRITVTITG